MKEPFLDKAFAEQKLASSIRLIDSLLAGDWPYSDSRLALERVREIYVNQLTYMEGLGSDISRRVVHSHCRKARSLLHEYMAFIGFILRSSNIRNAFEVYHPIKALGAQLLGAELHLVVSSEWNYSPFVYPTPTRELEDFIFVGIPAAEAQNALLIPVAGHELGHVVWRTPNFNREITEQVKRETLNQISLNWDDAKEFFSVEFEKIEEDLEAQSVWNSAFIYAQRQCEEIFCDAVALWIFGESFLNAFRYLLAPGAKARASGSYPTDANRADYLSLAATAFGEPFTFESDLFQHSTENRKDIFLIVADRTAKAVAPSVIDAARAHCEARGMKRPTERGFKTAKRSLSRLMPESNFDTVADVINAAWALRIDVDNWDIPGVTTNNRKMSILNDLLLKSFEVNEWESISATQ